MKRPQTIRRSSTSLLLELLDDVKGVADEIQQAVRASPAGADEVYRLPEVMDMIGQAAVIYLEAHGMLDGEDEGDVTPVGDSPTPIEQQPGLQH
jgi:hypothetical protein